MNLVIYPTYNSAIAWTPTGTQIPMVQAGGTLSSGKLVEDDVGEKSRLVINISASPATQNSATPGGYTQSRRNFSYLKPKILANGNSTVNTVRIQVSFDPESTETDVKVLLYQAMHAAWLIRENENFFVEGACA